MGDIADMMREGDLCGGCGVYLPGEGQGVPRYCRDCRRRDASPAPSEKVACKVCGRRVKFAGLADHTRDAHGHDLWGILIPGPDDVFPAPSKAVAEQMAKGHDAAMDEYVKANEATLSDYIKNAIPASRAQIVPWPWTAASHAKELASFRYEDWGLTAPAAGQEGGA